MSKGRPAKPLKLHDLHGTLRHDRHGLADDQYRPDGVPVKPKSLKGEASAFWDKVVDKLISDGIATEIDETILNGMCRWYGLYVRLQNDLDSTEAAGHQLYMEMKPVAMAWTEFDRLAAKFGLTPADRAKLAISGSKKQHGVESRNRANAGA